MRVLFFSLGHAIKAYIACDNNIKFRDIEYPVGNNEEK